MNNQIVLLGGVLASHFREGGAGGLIIERPVTNVPLPSSKRGVDNAFLLSINAITYAHGGTPGEEFTITGAVNGPDIEATPLVPETRKWSESGITLIAVALLDLPVKVNDGGLYSIDLYINNVHFAKLSFLVHWK